MDKRKALWISWILAFGAMLAGACIVSLCIGPASIPVKKIIPFILEGRGSSEYSIIFDIRMPRIILGLAVGGALSISGVMLQGMFRNPLVEPYTLGISGGAALGICVNIALKLGKVFGIMSFPVCGFAGAMTTVVLVYFLSTRRNKMRTQDMLLRGVMISFIASSLIMLIMAVSGTSDMKNIIFWIMGSLGESNRILIWTVFAVSVLSLLVSYLFCLDLNAFGAGEENARHLGIDPERTKRVLFILSSVLTGVSVSVAGMIGFVGLVVPHFVRIIVGGDHRVLLITSFLSGAAFLVLCDTFARTVISPVELPVGVVTGIMGGTLFVYALGQMQPVSGRGK
ncbi:MAG: iron ABC transporter permease [Candidatus Omnitrophota bacterium]|nr:iron ABC transporter permease [Candidatus Omnitrophota bacterium]